MYHRLPCNILFDLDGTLIDGIDDLVSAINTVLHHHTLAPVTRMILEPMLGDGMHKLAWRAFAARGITLQGPQHDEVFAQFVQAYANTDYRHTRLFDGALHTLTTLHAQGWKLGLASNKLTAACQRILENLEISHLFSAITGGDVPPAKKPDGRHLLYSLEQLGADPAAPGLSVMVGDHANDVLAAREAGIPVILVAFMPGATPDEQLEADGYATTFSGLQTILETMHGSDFSLTALP